MPRSAVVTGNTAVVCPGWVPGPTTTHLTRLCVAPRPLLCRRPKQQRPQMITRQRSTGQHLNFILPWTQRWSPSREQQLEQGVVAVVLFRGSSGCAVPAAVCCSLAAVGSAVRLPLSLATWAREGRFGGGVGGADCVVWFASGRQEEDGCVTTVL